MHKQKQTGFALHFILLAIALIAIAAGIGYLVYAKNIATSGGTSKAAAKWCDPYEGLCMKFPKNWQVNKNDNFELERRAIGGSALLLKSDNNTSIVYYSGLLNEQNDTVDNCQSSKEGFYIAYTHARTPSAALGQNTDLIKFSFNKDKKDEIRYAYIDKSYIPGNIAGGGCGNLVTIEETNGLTITTTLTSSYKSTKHPGQYVIFATAGHVKPQDLKDTEAIFKSVYYK